MTHRTMKIHLASSWMKTADVTVVMTKLIVDAYGGAGYVNLSGTPAIINITEIRECV